MTMTEWFKFKITFCFPDAVLDMKANTVTLKATDLMNLLARHEWLEYGRGRANDEPEPPKFMYYREGGWMDDGQLPA